ncbi:MAG: class I SAM-dependent methyltransferase [Candidatus Eremiobacteraeota bacterium]|nr:class I SAM-dependent methyltransferase [Candidatus Eremiobacteraeota bacterium]
MNLSDAHRVRFDGCMPQDYDEYLAPRLFTPWARRLLEAAKVGPNHHVVDVACGTGAVARLAAPMVGVRGRVVANDISAAMLDQARSHQRFPNAAGIEYFEAPAEELPFEDNVFQIALSQHGFQFFADRSRAASQMFRVLQKGGRVAVSIWGPLETCHFWHAIALATKRCVPTIAERLAQAAAFSHADALKEMLERAGFTKVGIQTERWPLVFEDGVGQAVSAVRGTAFGPALFELATVRGAFEAAVKPLFNHLLTDKGVVCEMTAHVATGIKP